MCRWFCPSGVWSPVWRKVTSVYKRLVSWSFTHQASHLLWTSHTSEPSYPWRCKDERLLPGSYLSCCSIPGVFVVSKVTAADGETRLWAALPLSLEKRGWCPSRADSQHFVFNKETITNWGFARIILLLWNDVRTKAIELTHLLHLLLCKHEILYEWINPTYLDMDYQIQIQEEFEQQSEILLKEFLKVGPHVLPGMSCLHAVLLLGWVNRHH